ncbi:threonine synthase [Anopheles sinensis]|uniref:Threonine synthase n=1 Tax=Anopheles sinensis TaxID=74873 RepID=A0A084W9S9_ANOSI|nr:threonine synthase [Anopheles sinensis]
MSQWWQTLSEKTLPVLAAWLGLECVWAGRTLHSAVFRNVPFKGPAAHLQLGPRISSDLVAIDREPGTVEM